MADSGAPATRRESRVWVRLPGSGSNVIANLLAGGRRRASTRRADRGLTYAQLFLLFMYFFSTRLGSPLLFSSGPAVIIRHVTVIFFDVFIEFCVERAFRSEKCSFCVRWRVCVSSDVDVGD